MSATEVEVHGKRLTLTNLDKVLYPEYGWTKAHVIDYYRRIAPVLLPHLRGRAVTLKRYPDGVDGPFFYEKTCPPHRPEWVRTAPVWSEGRGEEIPYCVLDDLPTLVWAANLADLEMHTFLGTAEDPETPTALVFDLDPGQGAGLQDCATVALAVRHVFDTFHLQSFVKTSGGKGMQVYVPLHTPTSFEETKPFARTVGEMVEHAMPDMVTTNMRKELRKGKVFVDWSQNDDHKTTVCVYSLRARSRPTVSAPLRWSEVEEAADRGDAERLRFLPDEVHARVDRHGDLFAPVLHLEQTLPALA